MSNSYYRSNVNKPSPPGPLPLGGRGSRASGGRQACNQPLVRLRLAGLALALLLGLAAGLSPVRAAGQNPPAAGPPSIEQLPPGFGVGRYDPAYSLVMTPAYTWHTFYGSTGNADIARAITADGSGGIYLAGESASSWTGPQGQAPLNPFGGGEYNDIVVVKLNSAGAYQWHTFYGGGSGDSGYGITVDGSGGVYVAGGSEASWTGPAGQAPLNPFAGSGDMVVVKLNSAGAYQWHTFSGGSGLDFDAARAITVDGSGGVYLAGYSPASWTGPGGQAPLNPFGGGYNDLVVVKLDSAGAYQWHTFYGGGSFDYGSGIAAAGGGIYVTGYSQAAWTGPGSLPPLNAWAGAQDIVVIRLDSSGAYQWHTFFGSSGSNDSGYAITVDGSGGLYLAGYSAAAWTEPAGQVPLNAFAGTQDMVAVKLDSNGAYQWHTFYGGSGGSDFDVSWAIAADGNGGVYLAGQSGAAWAGPAGQAPLDPFAEADDLVMVRLDSAGTYQWHTFYGGSGEDGGFAIAVDGSGLYAAGFSAAAWTGPGGRPPFNAFAGGMDITVVKTGLSVNYIYLPLIFKETL